jgi:hypothetical protein
MSRMPGIKSIGRAALNPAELALSHWLMRPPGSTGGQRYFVFFGSCFAGPEPSFFTDLALSSPIESSNSTKAP